MGRLNLVSLSGLFVLVALFSVQVEANALSQRFASEARQAIDKKNYPQAKNLCEQAMVADPKDVVGFACLGRTYAKTKKGKQADKYYDLAFARAPEDKNTLNWAGLRDLAKGRPDKARAKLNQLEKMCASCAATKNLRAAYLKYKAKKNASR